MKRVFDLTASATALVCMTPFLLVIAAAVKLTDRGPVLHWSKRIGRDNEVFLMPKFRTMRADTPQLPTHLMSNPDQWVTTIGQLLRRTSLDELPQLWSVVCGRMSLVGPRPALFNQADLVDLRTQAGIHKLRPGITGWAQVNGRDELPIPIKVQYDIEYAQRMSFFFDLKVLLWTAARALTGQGVNH